MFDCLIYEMQSDTHHLYYLYLFNPVMYFEQDNDDTQPRSHKK